MSASQQGAVTVGDASQRTPPQVKPPNKKGRKQGSRTKLRQPKQGGGKVVLKPSGDLQFSYVNFKPPYKYTSQLGVILKREYLGLVEDRNEEGALIRRRPAVEWADYFLNPGNELVVTNGDRVLSEFWQLFEVAEEDQEEAERVLDNYLKKRVGDMIYKARVDCVKEYYWKRDQFMNDKLACPIELQYEEYFAGRLPWCDDEVWPELCHYWCSEDFKEKQKKAQERRLGSEDITKNHGGKHKNSFGWL